MDTIRWLCTSEPAIRWQAMRDLTNASAQSIAVERARVSREGLGAEILARQEADGSWRRAGAPVWLPTLFTLLLLRSTGIDPAEPAVEAAVTRLESTLRWDDRPGTWDLRPVEGAGPFFEGEEEPCINGGVLALGGYFGRPVENLAQRLVAEQLGDGGWNCEALKSVRSSYHTTICVLEGLLEYERAAGPSPEITQARLRGESYLLDRNLFRRRTTGEVADERFLQLAFPPRYHYDVLRALEYFRTANIRPDPRMRDAIRSIEEKQQHDGGWLLNRSYDEALGFRFAESIGEPSRWNTLRALRVLRWYNGEPPQNIAQFQ